MARVLRTDGIAADLVSCVAVDDDGATIREFKYTPATISPTIGVGAPQADSWDGTPWFSIPNADAGRLTWTPSNPPWVEANGATEVFLIRYAGKGGTTGTLLLTGGSSLNRIATISGNDHYSPTGTAAGNVTGSAFAPGDTRIVGRTQLNGVSCVGYSYFEDGTPDGAPNSIGTPVLTINDYRAIMGGSDTNFVLGDLFLCAIFGRPLTQGEMDAFALDPFGSLFESAVEVDPVISGSLVNILPTSATIEVTTDTPNGTLWGILTQDTGTPSAEQIKAGQDATGSPAERANSVTIDSATGRLGLTGLTPETTYYAWFVQDAANGATSNVAGGSATTPAVPVPTGNGSVNDEILRATGGPTVNEGLYSWFNGAPPETLNDAELRWLKSQAGVTGTTVNDCWMQFLSIYAGSLNDRLLQYWRAQATAQPVFATFDPANKATIMVLSETDHRMVSNSAAARGMGFTTLGASTGKWYWEVLSLTAATAQGFGVGQAASNINEYLGSSANDWGYFPTGAYWTNAANQGNGLAYGVNSIVGFALDMAGNLTAYVDGVESFSVPHGLTGVTWPAGSDSSTGGVCDMVINCGDNGTFGGRVTAGGNTDVSGRGDFKYPVPAGYLSLCDLNGAA